MPLDPYLGAMIQGANSTAYQTLRAAQADAASARNRPPASPQTSQQGYGPPGQMSPEMMWMMQQQQMMMMQMYQQNQAMMNMMMMVMSGGFQNQQAQNPFYGFPIQMFVSQADQIPDDQQDQVQQLILGLLLKLQLSMSQISSGNGNQNTIFNTELGMVRSDLSSSALAALVNLKNEVTKVSMSSSRINEATQAAMDAGANPNDIYQAIRGGYNKDDQLPLSRFFTAMAQPTRTSNLTLQELYSALYQRAASMETPEDYNTIFDV